MNFKTISKKKLKVFLFVYPFLKSEHYPYDLKRHSEHSRIGPNSSSLFFYYSGLPANYSPHGKKTLQHQVFIVASRLFVLTFEKKNRIYMLGMDFFIQLIFSDRKKVFNKNFLYPIEDINSLKSIVKR